MPPSQPDHLPGHVLTAAMNSTGITAADLARTCGVMPAAVGEWLRPGGMLTDPGFIAAALIAFAKAGVEIVHDPDGREGEDPGVRFRGGWVVRPVR